MNQELKIKRLVLISTAGCIAPRHIPAMKEAENDLVTNYSDGIIDGYFPDAQLLQTCNSNALMY